MCSLFKNVIQRTCDKPVNIGPYFLKIIPDCYKTQEMCEKQLRNTHGHWSMSLAQEMCNEAVEKHTWVIESVPVHLRMQEMCEKAVKKHPSSLSYVPNDSKF